MKNIISKQYKELLSTLSNTEQSIESSEIIKDIFTEMSLIRYHEWVFKREMNRQVGHTTAELFQDIVAYQLKRVLRDQKVKISLEYQGKQIVTELGKKKTPRVDIAILYKGKVIVLIEVKTNIGWSRPKKNNWPTLEKRFKVLESSFEVPKENIFLILETPTNVSDTFLNYWWDKKAKKKHTPPKLPSFDIFKQVIPLYFKADPYYWDEYKSIRLTKEHPPVPPPEREVIEKTKRLSETYEIMNFDKIIENVKFQLKDSYL
tara:strand:- start:305 stop:1087 length:783 start_codon:yes stop_codon:yes gene_type:complete